MMFFCSAPTVLALLVSQMAMGLVSGLNPSFSKPVPGCAVGCLDGAPEGDLCVDSLVQENVSNCVVSACTIPDALAMQNTTLADCGVPPRDRSKRLVSVSNCMTVLAGIFVVIRFAYKILAKVVLGMDDWFIAATMAAAAVTAIIAVYGTTPNGLGRDVWTLTPQQITRSFKFFHVIAWIYFLKNTLLKLSILSFYMHLFPSRRTQHVLLGTFVFTTLWGVAFILASIFQCWPVDYFWTHWDGLHRGKCTNMNAIAWSNASTNIALDVWILVIPVPKLQSLQLHWKKKIGVSFMFCLGIFVTVVSAIRLRSLVNFSRTTNSTWEFYNITIWSTVEICVGIICACLPTARLVLVRILPKLAGTVPHVVSGHQRPRINERPSPHERPGSISRVIATEESSLDNGSSKDVEICLHRTHGVDRSSGDGTSLASPI